MHRYDDEEKFLVVPSLTIDDGYYVSNKGRVFSNKSRDFLVPNMNRTGKDLRFDSGLRVCLSVEGGPVYLYVARMVAEAFIEKRVPGCDVVLHKNGDKTDCRACNLAWRDKVFNSEYYKQPYYSTISALGPIICTDKSTGEVSYFSDIREAGETYGLMDRNIFKAIQTKKPSYYEPDLYFEFEDPKERVEQAA